MAVDLKTSFTLAKSYTPLFTGGSFAVSQDGTTLYTTLNEEVVMSNVLSGERLNVFRGDTSDVTTLALATESAASAGILLVAHRSLALRFYSVDDFSLIRSVARAHDAPIIVSASDPTGALFATGSADGMVKVWDAIHGHCTHVFRGHGGVVSALYFDINPSRAPRLFTASDDCRVRGWDLQSRKSLFVLEGHSSVVRGLAVTQDGSMLVSGGRDRVYSVWELPSGNLKQTIPVFETLEALGIVQVEADEAADEGTVKGKGKKKAQRQTQKQYVWTAGDSGRIRMWDLETGQEANIASSGAPSTSAGSEAHHVTSVCATANALITAHVDQNIVFHSLPDLQVSRQIVGYNDEVIDTVFVRSSGSAEDSSQTHLAVATNSDLIRLYDLQSFNTTLLAGHLDVVLCLAKSKDGSTLLSGSKDNTARIWRSDDDGDWSCVATCDGHLQSIGAVVVAKKEGLYAATASQDRTVKLWDLASLPSESQARDSPVSARSLVTLKVHEKDINSIDISPNDKLLATGSQDKSAKLFTVEYLPATKARPQPEAKLVPVGVFKGHKRGVWSVKFSPADQMLATASGDRTIKLWNINDFTCIKTFEGHTNTVLRIDYLPSGAQLASCASDGLVKVWNVKDEECVATLDNHEEKIWALAMDAEASTIVSGGADSVISFWQDVTEQEEEEKFAAEEEEILKQQDLSNYIDAKDYSSAVILALSMDQPRRLFGLLSTIISDTTVPGSTELSPVLAKVLGTLSPGDMFRLLEYVRDWNAKARDADVAQTVLHTLLRTHSAQEVLEAAPASTGLELDDDSSKPASTKKQGQGNIGEILEALVPYTERHYARADRLEQEAAFLDFVLAQMDDYAPEAIESEANGNSLEMDVDTLLVGR